VSGHPLDAYQKELKRYARPVVSVQRARRDEKLTVAGIVAALRERPTKTGKRMAWVTLEDLSGSVELVCFPGREAGGSRMDPKTGKWAKSGAKPGYENWETLLKGDEPILVTGSVQVNNRDEEHPVAELIVEDIQSLREVREKRVKRLELRLHVDMATDEKLAKLAEIAKKFAGATPIAIALHMPGEAETLIGGTSLKVQVTDELLESVNRLFGARVAEPG
jgi:DNA polymerase-3 subunit alpha